MLKNQNITQPKEAAFNKSVSIAGYSGLDVAVCMATAFQKLGKKVVILDRSPERDILNIFSPDAEIPSTERYGIMVSDWDDLDKEKYDLQVKYYGRNVLALAAVEKEDMVILTTDMYSEHARLLSKVNLPAKEENKKKKGDNTEIALPTTEENKSSLIPVIILNDMVNVRYGAKYLLSLINQKAVQKTFQIHFNKNDFAVKLSIGHEKFQLKKLTEAYRIVLNTLIQLLTGSPLTKKQLKQIYRK